ncbi:MAG: hypothetical protein ACKPER_09485, partial [Dolichospermum sp.]
MSVSCTALFRNVSTVMVNSAASFVADRKPSKVEGIKENSNFLREPVATEILQDTTHFSEDAIQILKFHGS